MEKQPVTEVHVNYVPEDKKEVFQEWLKKVHQVESTFPGFLKVYEQPPLNNKEGWVTLLQFDSLENLENWVQSVERKKLMAEVEGFVTNRESHRVLSSFEGWFAGENVNPPVWKQTLLVLLVLFPIVMLETKYLAPLLSGLPLSPKTFLLNAISVVLISWPFLPFVIKQLKWWLKPNIGLKKELIGLSIVLFLHFLEVYIFYIVI